MRWPVVGLVVMGLLVAINQVMLFMKSTDVAMANEQLAKLKYENSEMIKLYEENKQLIEENHELKLKETLLETDNRYLKEKETEMEKIKKQVADKDLEITNLLKKVVDLPTPAPTSPSLPTIEQSLFDSLTAPNNVITDKDNLKVVLDTYNTFGTIRNTDKFQLEEGYIPIVIRAFKKHEYFQFVLEHYRNVQGINKTIMIISHDGIFPEMFKLVESIDFCQVKQVIYPHSGHVFTNRFPGPDTTIPDEKDQYNHDRPFPHVSIKHHYWWSMNYVWDGVLPSHNGSMIFNEDDHVPTWDYYITAKAVTKIKEQKCPQCWCIRMYGDKQKNREAHNIVLAYYLGNIAMIINRQEFEQFRAAGESFCKHDDYNWDWTIVQLKALDLLPKLSMVVTYSRAEHMGKCGSHVKSSSCEISEEDRRIVDDVDRDLREKDGGNWSTYNFNPNPMDPPPAKFQGYGGWGHSYDHKLCMQNIIPRKEGKIEKAKEKVEEKAKESTTPK